MKRKSKGFFAAILAVSLVFGTIFTGCGNSSGGQEPVIGKVTTSEYKNEDRSFIVLQLSPKIIGYDDSWYDWDGVIRQKGKNSVSAVRGSIDNAPFGIGPDGFSLETGAVLDTDKVVFRIYKQSPGVNTLYQTEARGFLGLSYDYEVPVGTVLQFGVRVKNLITKPTYAWAPQTFTVVADPADTGE